ncbi:MAG: hypothetical protein AMXMBFR23_00900 [Chloroflexota bacterium]
MTDDLATFSAVLDALALPPYRVQAFDPDHPDFDAQRPLLVLPAQFEAARPLVRRRYPASKPARVVLDGVATEAPVAALPFDASAWLLPALPPEEDRRSIDGLRRVTERLFAPDGCPWDREQTPQTLRRYLIEEVYELVDAIDREDAAGLREEVGDVLAHMFMQTALAQQSGAFTLEDAVEYANAKFVRRHPHVFGEEESGSPEDLLDRWEAIKAAERAAKGEVAEARPEGALDSVPRAAPALQRAQMLARRAVRHGLGDAPTPAREAVVAALEADDLALLLFAVARLAAEQDADAEETLREAAGRFTSAFQALEDAARTAGVEVAALPEAERLAAWASVATTPTQ